MHVKNIVFEGGGVKGVAYIGAIKELSKFVKLNEVQNVAGTSSGSLAALMLCLNYSPNEIEDILYKKSFREFLDNDFGFVRDTYRLVSSFGWYKGEHLSEWLGEIIENKGFSKNITYRELHQMKIRYPELGLKDLYTVGTNLNLHSSEIFSYTSKHADTPISLGVRISMSIPLFFVPVTLNDMLYIDGGLLRNYPINIFDLHHFNGVIHNQFFDTIGIRLDSEYEITRYLDPNLHRNVHKIGNLFQFLNCLITTALNEQDDMHANSFDQFRTIYCNTQNIETTDFNLDNNQKKLLINAGANAVRDFFARYQAHFGSHDPIRLMRAHSAHAFFN